jgi:hypothetical protein
MAGNPTVIVRLNQVTGLPAQLTYFAGAAVAGVAGVAVAAGLAVVCFLCFFTLLGVVVVEAAGA